MTVPRQLTIRRRPVERHLEQEIPPQICSVVAILIAGRNHQQATANDVSQSEGDLIGRSRIYDTGCETSGDTQAFLDLAERQDPAIGRQQPAVEFGHHRLAGHG